MITGKKVGNGDFELVDMEFNIGINPVRDLVFGFKTENGDEYVVAFDDLEDMRKLVEAIKEATNEKRRFMESFLGTILKNKQAPVDDASEFFL